VLLPVPSKRLPGVYAVSGEPRLDPLCRQPGSGPRQGTSGVSGPFHLHVEHGIILSTALFGPAERAVVVSTKINSVGRSAPDSRFSDQT
jgi:hypothetical protein